MSERLASVLLRTVASWDGLPNRLRPALLRRSGITVGQRVLIASGTRFTKFGPVVLGDGVYLNHDCYFDAEASITIGADSSIASHVRFVTATHGLGGSERRAGPHFGLPVTVGTGTWIGSNAVILPGVTVGSGCVIAAGSVVTKNCEPNFLYGGVPAKPIRRLP